MDKNRLYAIIALLVVVVVALGIYVIQKEREPEGVEIKVDQNGISVEQK